MFLYPKGAIMLSFTGDLYLKEKVDVNVDFPYPFIINLEYPIVNDLSSPAAGKVNLGVDRGWLLESFKRKPYGVCLANNHILDYGAPGAESTLEYLICNGIKFFGFGNKLNNYNNPLNMVTNNNEQIDVFGYCDSSTSPSSNEKFQVAPLNIELIKQDILSSNAKIKIVCLHWGDEENSYPSRHERLLASKIAKLGVNYIIGHHAHVIQPTENIGECKVFYNLGNFYFPNIEEPYGWDGAEFKGKYRKLQTLKNKQGLIVDINEGGSNYRTIENDDGIILENQSIKIPRIIFASVMYPICHRSKIITIMLKRFLQKPRLPNYKQIKRFIGI
jgi:poly-gamma-glutamate synthesis protein (capsule biosynthesis protein)